MSEKAFKCAMCGQLFTRLDSLKRHRANAMHNTLEGIIKKMYQCNFCSMKSRYRNSLLRHLKNKHNLEHSVIDTTKDKDCVEIGKEAHEDKSKVRTVTFCSTCNLDVASEKFSSHLRTLLHKKKCCQPIEPGVFLVKSGYKGNVKCYRISYDNEINNDNIETNFTTFFSNLKEKIIKLIQSALLDGCLKVNFELFGLYATSTKTEEDGDNTKTEIKSFNSKYEIVTAATELDDLYSHFFDVLKTKAEEFQVSV